jgi:rare lipoprotein A
VKIKYLIFSIFLLPICLFGNPSFGKASWYGNECDGKHMANGHSFNPNNLTAASWFYPLGTLVKVTNLENGKFVIVKITDRGPSKKLVHKGRIIDLSRASFNKIKNYHKNLLNVEVERIN